MKKTVGFEITSTSNLIRRSMYNSAIMTKSEQMTGMHGWVLGYLYDNADKCVYQRDLEKISMLRRSTTTSALQKMETNGLIQRLPVAEDARLKKLVLTEKGKLMHETFVKEAEELEKRMSKNVSREELDALIKTLEKIKKNLK